MKLNAEQKKIIAHGDGPALVLAVPGSGKTTVLLHRIDELLKQGANPKTLITLSFSRATVASMRERFQRTFPKDPLPKFFTIHSLAYQILQAHGRLRRRPLNLIESEEQVRLLSQLYESLFHIRPSYEQVDELLLQIGKRKNSLPFKEVHSTIVGFDEISEMYEDIKHQNRWIDFDDMVPLALKCLKDDAYLRQKFRKGISHLQLDEGQDTSFVQLALIDMLCPHENVLIVADDDQSIYGFRGTGPEVLHHWRNQRPSMPLYYLSTNFRCHQPIVVASRKLIEKNKDRVDKPMNPFHEQGLPVQLVTVRDEAQEMDWVLKAMTQYPHDSIGILYRSNLSAMNVVEALERRDIPFAIDPQRIALEKHWICQDIKSFWQLAKHPHRVEVLERIYYKLNAYLAKRHIAWLKAQPQVNHVFDDLMAYPELPHYYLPRLKQLKKTFANLPRRSPAQVLALIFRNLGYEQYVREKAIHEGTGQQGSLQILHLLETIAQHATSMDTFWGRIHYLETLLFHARRDTQQPIQLTTAHGSKGLEYDRVFILDVAQGCFPMTEVAEADEEEERRLFYVAMTRARKELTILYPQSLGEMSPFFAELKPTKT